MARLGGFDQFITLKNGDGGMYLRNSDQEILVDLTGKGHHHYVGKTSKGDWIFIEPRNGFLRNGKIAFALLNFGNLLSTRIVNDTIYIIHNKGIEMVGLDGKLMRSLPMGLFSNIIAFTDNKFILYHAGGRATIDLELNVQTTRDDAYILTHSADRYATHYYPDQIYEVVTLFDSKTNRQIWQHKIKTDTYFNWNNVIVGDMLLAGNGPDIHKLTSDKAEILDVPEIYSTLNNGKLSPYNNEIINIFASGDLIVIRRYSTVVLNHQLQKLFVIPDFICLGIVDNYLYSDTDIYDIFERKTVQHHPDAKIIQLIECRRVKSQLEIRDLMVQYIDWPLNVLSVVAYYI